MENEKTKVVAIGEWIDQYLEKFKTNVTVFGTDNANMELINLETIGVNVVIPSTDSLGNVAWHKVTNLTRHDPSTYLYRVRTKWGRQVDVVASQSLLVWNSEMNMFETKNSEDVKVGDKLGTTFQLQAYNKIEYVHMRDYLTSERYIFGSDYNTTNGTKKWIMNGNVYTKCAKRTSAYLPEIFELNRENGFFVGLYLAEGNTCKDYIGIANNDIKLRQKVIEWFDHYNIFSKTCVKEFNPLRPGLSTSVRGYSTILVEFLEKFVGKYSHGKYVPSEAFNAPDEFVKGLIDGYISGDGCVTEYHVVVSSVSQKLINGIATLLTRFGIFSKLSRIQQKKNNVGSKNILPRYNLSIQSRYVHKFAKTFTLTHDLKQEKLNILHNRASLTSMQFLYEEQNGVILDRVVDIQKYESMNQKVYDITVPDTLNFQLFNGLNVHDTSETGYLQRKLAKAMEDCKISYDHTVRNASGCIIQMLYGEDGMDPTKIESQTIPHIEMDYAKLHATYMMTSSDDLETFIDKDVYETFKKNAAWDTRIKRHFDQILDDRIFMIKKIFNNKLNSSIMYPVSFQRIITNTRALFKNPGMSDLNPVYVLDQIEKLCEDVYVSKVCKGNMFFQILVRAYLSPKRVVMEYKFNKSTFDHIINTIKMRFYDSIAHPSEMVGIISAQSIGEPCTQLTLNSVEWNTEILISINGQLTKCKIGEWIDNQLNIISTDKIENHPNDTVLGWIQEKNVKILSCDEDGHITWKLIEAVTRHPPINEDGSNTLVNVKTRSGRNVIATKAKSFLKRENNKIVPVSGEDLKVGDFVPVSNIIPVTEDIQLNNTWGGDLQISLDASFGFFVGLYLYQGICLDDILLITNINQTSVEKVMQFCDTYNFGYHVDSHNSDYKRISIDTYELIQKVGQSFGTYSLEKKIPVELICAPDEFCRALFEGYISNERRCFSVNKMLLEDIQQLLARFGIQSSVRELKDAYKLVYDFDNDIIPNVVTEKYGTINISRSRLETYKNTCDTTEDKAIIDKILDENIVYDEVVEITEVTSNKPYVYDFTVQDTRNFNIYNGLAMRDTFHLSGVSSASKAVRGVPRMKELLSVTKNIKAPTLTIYLNEAIGKNKNDAKQVLTALQTTYFKDIVKSSKIYFDPDDFNTTIDDDKLFMATYKEFIKEELMEESALTPWLLRMEFDKEKMKEHEIVMMDVSSVIHDYYKDTVNCMFSDDSSNNIIMRIKLPQAGVSDEKDTITELRALEKNIMENIIISGVHKINKVVMNNKEYNVYNDEKMIFEKTNEWVLETNGTNLIEILGHKDIDYTRTISNDVNEIYEVLGIEAARAALYNEISDIILDADLYVNYRHIALLVDTMTSKGYLLSIDRHGINRVDIGPLAKCSFEEVTDMLVKAGIFAEVDKISGVSANIMLGQIPPYGTGETDVMIDEQKLQELATVFEEDEIDVDPYIQGISPGYLESICDMSNIDISFSLPSIDTNMKALDVPSVVVK